MLINKNYVRELETDLMLARGMLREIVGPYESVFNTFGLKSIKGGRAFTIQKFIEKDFPRRMIIKNR